MTTPSTDSTAPMTATMPAFGKFALVFGIVFVILYWVCVLRSWPVFTYYPATGALAWGRLGATPDTGPAMYWYGWVAVCIIVSTAAGFLGTLLPDSVVRRIPLALAWLLPLLAFPLAFYAVLPLLTHG
jgi:hypothetical protein